MGVSMGHSTTDKKLLYLSCILILSSCTAFTKCHGNNCYNKSLLDHRTTSPFASLKLQANSSSSSNFPKNDKKCEINACLVGYVSPDQKDELCRILHSVGYTNVFLESDAGNKSNNADADDSNANANGMPIFKYKYIKASGMLKLVQEELESNNYFKIDKDINIPKYVPVQSGEENVLVKNGWSYLDTDESEPLSSFDIDAANIEGQYKPKWGIPTTTTTTTSTLGFNIKRMKSEDILSEVNNNNIIQASSKKVLLEGGTDKPNIKMTNNGYDFSGSISSKLQNNGGLFTCAIGGNPLFTTNDLSPLTASSGWLTFFRVISNDHIELIYPDSKECIDQRVEVIDSKTGCHLGHYFGADGYCINASALNFFPSSGAASKGFWNEGSHPISWLSLHGENMLNDVLNNYIQKCTILLGAGCFWHVEYALRRLPGVIETKVGYAGGTFPSPTYEDICKKDTNHAEVVKVIFDPIVCNMRKLIDCFLAMHDPTIVRAHGKKAIGSGQYRSCIFILDDNDTTTDVEKIALDAIDDCNKQLAKRLSTEVRILPLNSFWIAEERHQRHDERVKKKSGKDIETLSEVDWLLEYGRRSSSIFGSSETMQVAIDDSNDDGMARLMI